MTSTHPGTSVERGVELPPMPAAGTSLTPSRGRESRLGPRGRAGLVLLLLLVVTAIGVAPWFPRGVTPASAAPEVFSAERAMAQLPTIAAEPHPNGSPAQARVRDYLVQQLTALGLETQVQDTIASSPRHGTTAEVQNVVARLRGTQPTGAVVVFAHYDSVPAGPGAADNGTGVVTLLETTRALVAGPPPRNDVIVLFDDAEEIGFIGSQAFVTQHPWMSDVRVVVCLDTAVHGPISLNQTGAQNGWLVQVLARSFTGGVWTSTSGAGGVYDYEPFRLAGFQGFDLEDDYAFYEQHTAADRPEIVSAASVQQFGDQTLSVTRELSSVDLSNPWGPDESFMTLPLVGLVHYPKTWELPLAAVATVLFVVAAGLALRRGLATWAGLGMGLGGVATVAAVGAIGVGWLWNRVPEWLGWNTAAWAFWPEVVPPGGEYIFAGFGLLVLVPAVGVYLVLRRFTEPVNVALAALAPVVVLSLVLWAVEPHAQIVALWPGLIGSLVWCGAVIFGGRRIEWAIQVAMVVAAAVACFMIVPGFVESFMGEGLSSVATEAALWAVLLGLVLPTLDTSRHSDGHERVVIVRNGLTDGGVDAWANVFESITERVSR